MSKEEMLRKLKGIHLLYSMPQLAQNMMPEHFAIVEYEKLAYEQQAIIDQLTNNWNELEKEIDRLLERQYASEKFAKENGFDTYLPAKINLEHLKNKIKEIKENGNNGTN